MSRWNRREELEELAGRLKVCKACPLADSRTNVVVGAGNPDADVLLIGEAPGEVEDLMGEAFAGPAGEMLGLVLDRSGWSRDELIIANTVRCRPTDVNKNNRPPTKQEIQACNHWLIETIYAVDPVVIIAAGRIPTFVLGKFKKLADATRDMFDTYIPGRTGIDLIYPVMAIHHPSDLERRAHHYDIFQKTVDQLRHLRRTIDTFRKLGRGVPTNRSGEGQEAAIPNRTG